MGGPPRTAVPGWDNLDVKGWVRPPTAGRVPAIAAWVREGIEATNHRRRDRMRHRQAIDPRRLGEVPVHARAGTDRIARVERASRPHAAVGRRGRGGPNAAGKVGAGRSNGNVPVRGTVGWWPRVAASRAASEVPQRVRSQDSAPARRLELELRQLREEMQELRKAIEALTKEVEAARQAK